MNLKKLNERRKRRIKRRDKYRDLATIQFGKYRATKRRGYLKAGRANARKARKEQAAVRRLEDLIAQASRPSPNFSYAEFDCHNGEKVPVRAYAGLNKLCGEVLEPIRAEFGRVTIHSGYRPPAYNAAIGGEPNSYHLYDRAPAADFSCERGTPEQWAAAAERHSADGIGTYPSSNFVHIDQRGYTARWSG